VTSAPSAQNALDIFEGEWASSLDPVDPVLRAGNAAVFADARIDWALSKLGDVSGKTVLELGPLEGGHTYMLERRGAQAIVAIESNTRAYLKCLVVKEIVQLRRARFLCGDFVQYLRRRPERFDFVFASGVLYHMQDPVELIDLCARITDRLFVWTHYYDEFRVAANAAVAAKFSGETRASVRAGFHHTLHRYDYGAVFDSPGFCGGSETCSYWMSRSELMASFRHFGFRDVEIGFDHPDHPNGPGLAIAAKL
jgi:uncharacterized protein DUF1698